MFNCSKMSAKYARLTHHLSSSKLDRSSSFPCIWRNSLISSLSSTSGEHCPWTTNRPVCDKSRIHGLHPFRDKNVWINATAVRCLWQSKIFWSQNQALASKYREAFYLQGHIDESYNEQLIHQGPFFLTTTTWLVFGGFYS